MAKLDDQRALVTALRAFTGPLPFGYADEKEFFLVSLRNMEEYLAALQKETLAEVCARFAGRLEAGVGQRDLEEFKSALDRLVSEADFKRVTGKLSGSHAFLKEQLSRLEPVSMLAAVKKDGAPDPDMARRVKSVYDRLGFPALVEKVRRLPSERGLNAILAQARRDVAEYCLLYRVQTEASDTLTPFSMSYVDAVLAACHLLYKDAARACGR